MTEENEMLEGIAIIGMAVKLPGADTVRQFWNNLKNGVESVTFFSDQELIDRKVPQELLENPNYVKAAPMLEGIDQFDAAFFGFTPRDAEVLDPQHRVFVEKAWEAVENAGYDLERYEGSIGVYAGAGFNRYLQYNLLKNRDFLTSTGINQLFFSNDKDFLSTRVSYLLNLDGPSINVQTACSSSLVALHLACESIQNEECDMAIVGGSSLAVPQGVGYLYEKDSIASPDGHCRTFDAKSKGTTFGSGAAAVLLKHVEDAVEDGDTIHAVVKGTAINNDGALKVGYTAPGRKGQTGVIVKALGMAEINPETIGYVEAHGTGTSLGDPIEVESLTKAYRFFTKKRGFCAIGSLKSNIGHLDTAAGISGLIKTVLTLKNGWIPPTLGFESPNPAIDFENSPFRVNNKLTRWEQGETPRRAAISSFGIGGTNAHAILEEAPTTPEPATAKNRTALIPLSAKTETALSKACENLANFLEEEKETNLANVAFTHQMGRKVFTHRTAIACQTIEEAISQLRTEQEKPASYVDPDKKAPEVAFLFPGQGSQYANMTLDLYENEPEFRETVDQCLSLLPAPINTELPKILFPKETEPKEAHQVINQTQYTQPALFVIEYAIARLLMVKGINPTMMIGHSVGEYVAACIAGVFSLEDALMLISERGRLIQSLPEGSMIAVSLSGEQIKPWLSDQISLAAQNVESQSVLSGPDEAINELKQRLKAKGISSIPLHTSHAFHSSMMEPILEEYQACVAKVKRNAPTTPFVSNVTGDWISEEQATDPTYWGQHIRGTVKFSEGIQTLLNDKKAAIGNGLLLVESGPGKTLTGFTRNDCARLPHVTAIQTVRHLRESIDDALFFHRALGQLWAKGVDPDWETLNEEEEGKRIPLPTYPFDHQSYWIEPDEVADQPVLTDANIAKESIVKDGVENWFYKPTWKKATALPNDNTEEGEQQWLILPDELGLGEQLRNQLLEQGKSVTIPSGEELVSNDFRALLQRLKKEKQLPTHLIHCLSVTNEQFTHGVESYQQCNRIGFESIVAFMQAWGRVAGNAPLKMTVLSNQLHQVTGSETINPAKATTLGPCRVIPFEYQSVQCKSIDPDITREQLQNETPESVELLRNLIKEATISDQDSTIAYRAGERWTQTFDTVQPLPIIEDNDRFKENGVYLVTGGLGGIALALIESITQRVAAKFVLTGRSPFPAKEQWEQWLIDYPEASNLTSQRIQKLIALEKAGAEIMVCGADVNQYDSVSSMLTSVRETWGAVNGVIHAAGLPGDSVIQFSEPETFANVLAPKTEGTYILEKLLQAEAPEFMILCSSVSSYVGGPGQAAYCAANSFLDHFVQSAHNLKGTELISINWPAWSEVGMAVNAALSKAVVKLESQPTLETTDHPLLRGLLFDSPEKKIFKTTLNPEKDWVLDEHRISGMPLVPGVTYMEMARAAWAAGNEAGSVEIRDLFFLTPLILDEQENRDVYTVLTKENEGYTFRIASQLPTDEQGEANWVEHAKGTLLPKIEAEIKTESISAIIENCGRIIPFTNDDFFKENWRKADPDQLITLGPRWKCLKTIHATENEGLVLLELSEPFQNDTETYRLHPALMDIATSVGSGYVAQGEYLPFYYKRITVNSEIPAKIYSHIRFLPEEGSGETIRFDLRILDENGRELIDVEGFTKKKVHQNETFKSENGNKPQSELIRTQQLNWFYENLLVQPSDQKSSAADFNSITTAEATEAFQRIITQRDHGQLLLSPTNFNTILKELGKKEEITSNTEPETFAKPAKPAKLYPRPELKEPYVAPKTAAEKRVTKLWCEMLGFEKIGINDSFFDLGGDSLLASALINRVNQELNIDISVVDLFDQPNIKTLASLPQFKELKEEALIEAAPVKTPKRTKRASTEGTLDVAIIGMAARFPGAKNTDQFWDNLQNGTDTLTELDQEYDGVQWGASYVNKAQVLADIDLFDASFFGYSAKDALVLSPQHRFFLENSWEAMEDAGYDPKRYDGRVGVFAGGGNNSYLYNLISDQSFYSSLGPYQLESGNDLSYISSSVSFRLNLTGPAMSIQTACSTSLVAIHYARLSLEKEECEMALAGGVSIRIPQDGYHYYDGGIYSPDGYVRTFDANAKGTIFSSGCGVIVMKPLADAIEDNDSIYAVIKGSAVNNDGSGKAGFTAPSRTGQKTVITEAQANAGVSPAQIQYVETHGTATVIGDPIEVDALTQVFGNDSDKKQYCALGSVKSNIGHTDIAAGVAGVIKTVLALKNEQLPPTLNYQTPNPAIDFENSPFYVNYKLNPWKRSDVPRIAGVSSFGVGGTNAHLILQEAPAPTTTETTGEAQLLPLSARTETALEAMTKNLADYLDKNPTVNLADVAHTLQVGRREFEHRRVLSCQNPAEASTMLRNRTGSSFLTTHEPSENRSVAFLFGKELAIDKTAINTLYRQELTFREKLEQAAEAVDLNVNTILNPMRDELEQANFIIQYALGRLWIDWGIRPDSLTGDNTGEFIAAALSGAISLREALDRRSGSEPDAVKQIRFQKPEEAIAEDPELLLLTMGTTDLDTTNRIINSVDDSLKTVLGKLWLAGVEIHWNLVYGETARKRIALPTYPFERQRYWVEQKQLQASEEKTETGPFQITRNELNQWFYAPTWKNTPLPKGTKQTKSGIYLLFADQGGLSEKLESQLRQQGQQAIVLKPGEEFAQISDSSYELSPSNAAHYRELLADLQVRDAVPTRIAHFWNHSDECLRENIENVAKIRENGFGSLTAFMQAWGQAKLENRLKIGVVSNHLQQVTGKETVNPAKALIQGPCQVIPVEYPGVTCKSIDLDWNPETVSEESIDQLHIDLFLNEVVNKVAWRGEKRWSQSLETVEIMTETEESPKYKENGVYLITGGLGGIALSLIETITNRFPARFALVGRSPFPEKELWPQWIEESDDKDPTSEKIKKLIALEKNGAELMVLSADCCDIEAMRQTVDQVTERFGSVNGVIHAAGVPGKNMIQFGDSEIFTDVQRPKVEGTLILEQLFQNQPLDFFLLCSSVESMLGRYGQVAYCSANAFPDSFAQSRVVSGTTPIISINWPAWSEVGMAVNTGAIQGGSSDIPHSINPAEGGEVLDLALSQNGYSQLLVSPISPETFAKSAESKQSEKETTGTRFPRPKIQEVYAEAESHVEQKLSEIWQEVLGYENIGINDNFFELGGDSLLAVSLVSKVNEKLDSEIAVVDLFDHPSIKTLATFEGLRSQANVAAESINEKKSAIENRDVAIIGMAGRFSGAENLDKFWENLRDSVDTLQEYGKEHLRELLVPEDSLNSSDYVRKGHVLPEFDMFDASFFDYSDREALIMSPNHRLFMESSWEALEHAGYTPDAYDGKIGVFAGSGTNDYIYNLFSDTELMSQLGPYQFETGNDVTYISNSVSFKLNLKGISLSIQTACSSSLVAIHQACQSLLSGEIQMALSGGVTVSVPHQTGYQYYEGGVYSPDGYCRTFDEDAKGSIFSSGVGVVLLKPLNAALKDRDTVYGVIKGSAVNNDGSQKAGFTAPNRSSQRDVILDAQSTAGITADRIQYIESHGTATPIGDPIELDALTQAFGKSTDKKQYCAIGAVKTNIGHTIGAAGIAGLLKTVLAMKHEQLPPTMHFKKPNPKIDFENSPFYVADKLSDWKRSETPRIAGISSFGIGGSNAHTILQEAPIQRSGASSREWQLLTLSAKTESALERMSLNLANFLETNRELSFPDVAYTLKVGRQHFEYQKTVLCQNVETAIEQLKVPKSTKLSKRPVTFLFPGEGTQYVRMAADLYETEKQFKQYIDYCCAWLWDNLNLDLKKVLYPINGDFEPAVELLNQSEYAQPALFVIEYSLAQLLMSWGIMPTAFIGQSVGEYVAASLAGVFTLEEALKLVVKASRSAVTASVQTEYLEALSTIRLRAPKIPFLSNLSGTWIQEEEAVKPEYWLQKFQEMNRFNPDLTALPELSNQLLLEVGPGKTVTNRIAQLFENGPEPRMVTTLRDRDEKKSDWNTLLGAMGELWLNGVSINWNQYYQEEARYRVGLPTYPFEKKQYWVNRKSFGGGTVAAPSESKAEESASPVVAQAPRPELTVEYVAPETETEKDIVAIWQEIFGLETVGINDDFFELGGDSLILVSIRSRILNVLGVEIEMEDLFDQATPKELAQLIESTKSDDTVTIKETMEIPVVSRDVELPLAFSQQRLWLIDRIHNDSRAYNLTISHKIPGDVDPNRLEESLKRLAQRQEILRTTFAQNEVGEPILVIAPTASVHLNWVDLRHLPEEEREAEGKRVMVEESAKPFDLETGPLFRTSLITVDKNLQFLSLVIHHAIFDGWSINIFVKELMAIYHGIETDQASLLPDISVQYADYASWQRKRQTEEKLQEQLESLTTQLGGADFSLNLPTDYPRPETQSSNGAKEYFTLPGELSRTIDAFNKQEGVTLFMTLLAAFRTLLYRYSGQEDFLIGTAVANRQQEELEKLIGFFSNTLVLRTDLQGEPSFRELIQKVRKETLQTFQYQDFPFERLIEGLQPERDLSRSPLFQTMFILHNFISESQEPSDLNPEPLELHNSSAEFELKLEIWEDENELKCHLEYCTDLFAPERIKKMINHFQIILTEALKNPDQPINAIPLLTPAEQQQILADWNQTKRDYPTEKTVHQLFAEQAIKTPDKVAVSFEGKTLTYRELDDKANQLAHYLVAQGVTNGDLVGICLERSLDMLIGLFAILKTGAAYVPLDPIYPIERLRLMVKDAQVKLLLTEQRLAELFGNDSYSISVMEQIRETVTAMSTTEPEQVHDSKNPAYVIYTSGTTGTPKGVRITHQNLVNFIYSMKEEPGLSDQDTLLSVTTICFDIFGLELYLPLLFGGTHYLVSSAVSMDAPQLAEHLDKSGATVMQATPGTWKLLLETGWNPETPIKVLCGGEPLPQDLAIALTNNPAVELWNMYGPTETTIWSSVARISDGYDKIGIGKPIANTTIHILNDSMWPVPVGVPGEIYIGGDGLAQDYLGKPELTEKQFIPNPFQEGERLYRTGDLGRYFPDGTIECLGRKDQQVKLRGFRIELGDIEFHLNELPQIREAVAQVEGKDDNKKLIAWLIPASNEKIDPEFIRAELRKTLPLYMVPSDFCLLDTIPKTQNGKIDRKRLAQIKGVRVESVTEFIPPQSGTEEKIAQVWKQVLKQEKIGRDQNFFDLGGHSMLMIQVAKALNGLFEKKITITELFMFPTIQQVAEHFDGTQEAKDEALFKETISRNRARKQKGRRA